MLELIPQFSAWKGVKNKENTVKSHERQLRWFCLYMGNPDISQITEQHITGYINLMKEYGWDENTMIPVSNALKQFFLYLDAHDQSPFKPSLIQIPNKRYKIPRIANMGDTRKLLALEPTDQNESRRARNRAIIALLWTGVRVGELISINISSIDFAKQQATIYTEKNRGSKPTRVIEWGEEANRYLRLWLEAREKVAQTVFVEEPDALFISIAHQNQGRRMGPNGVNLMLYKYAKQAGVPYSNAHAYRHAKARDIINRGGDVSDVANILGHATLNSSMPYLALAGDRLSERMKQFLTV